MATDLTRVLIVDDDEAVLDSLPDVIASSLVEVVTAANIDEATRVLDTQVIDLVITDLRLRGCVDTDGLDLVSRVKAGYPGAEVVLITGLGGPEIREEALRRGAVDYWQKSMSIPELVDRIRALGVPV